MCGVIAIFNYQNSNLIIFELLKSLEKLKNRGRDSYGILLSNKKDNILIKDNLLIDINKIQELEINKELFTIALGHSRYATSYQSESSKLDKELSHPFKGAHIDLGEFYLIHNGNINFSAEYQEKYIGLNDTKIMVKIIEQTQGNEWIDIIEKIIKNIPGVYNIVISTNNEIYAFKDKFNIRPLCLGSNKFGYCVASESIALGNYKYLREIKGGEIVKISNAGIESKRVLNQQYRICLFEYIYFLNPKSIMNQNEIFSIRYSLGFKLGEGEIIENKDNVVVIGSPDTGIPSGKGFAECLGLKYEQFLEKNKTKGRSFIMADDEKRIEECRKKFLVNPDFTIKNKIVYFVDDSMVRGNTTKRIVKLLYEYGAREIHIRISSPKIIDVCKFGIDIPTREELVMAKQNENEYVEEVRIKSLKFLDLEDMTSIIGNKLGIEHDNFCIGCFTGKYEKELLEW